MPTRGKRFKHVVGGVRGVTCGGPGFPEKELQVLLGLLYPCDGVVGPGVISADVGAQEPEV